MLTFKTRWFLKPAGSEVTGTKFDLLTTSISIIFKLLRKLPMSTLTLCTDLTAPRSIEKIYRRVTEPENVYYVSTSHLHMQHARASVSPILDFRNLTIHLKRGLISLYYPTFDTRRLLLYTNWRNARLPSNGGWGDTPFADVRLRQISTLKRAHGATKRHRLQLGHTLSTYTPTPSVPKQNDISATRSHRLYVCLSSPQRNIEYTQG